MPDDVCRRQTQRRTPEEWRRIRLRERAKVKSAPPQKDTASTPLPQLVYLPRFLTFLENEFASNQQVPAFLRDANLYRKLGLLIHTLNHHLTINGAEHLERLIKDCHDTNHPNSIVLNQYFVRNDLDDKYNLTGVLRGCMNLLLQTPWSEKLVGAINQLPPHVYMLVAEQVERADPETSKAQRIEFDNNIKPAFIKFLIAEHPNELAKAGYANGNLNLITRQSKRCTHRRAYISRDDGLQPLQSYNLTIEHIRPCSTGAGNTMDNFLVIPRVLNGVTNDMVEWQINSAPQRVIILGRPDQVALKERHQCRYVLPKCTWKVPDAKNKPWRQQANIIAANSNRSKNPFEL